jgi:hypothetical protein
MAASFGLAVKVVNFLTAINRRGGGEARRRRDAAAERRGGGEARRRTFIGRATGDSARRCVGVSDRRAERSGRQLQPSHTRAVVLTREIDLYRLNVEGQMQGKIMSPWACPLQPPGRWTALAFI